MQLKNKYKIEVFLTQETKDKVKSKALELGTTMAGIIKRALEGYLK